MPKTDIDYANTIIYKITCKDPTIKDVYVGHTTNFVQRKRAHKQSCMNPKSTNHTCKLYTIIREHGGWTNWLMEIIHFFKCNDQCEARIKEQEYFILLNATLNSVEPMPVPKPPVKTLSFVIGPPKVTHDSSGFVCDKADNSCFKFYCDACNYGTIKKSSMTKHLSTSKHINLISNNVKVSRSCSTGYSCNICEKSFNDRAGLWRHTKKCTPKTTLDEQNFVIDKEFVMQLIKENIELKTLMLDTQNKIIKRISNENV